MFGSEIPHNNRVAIHVELAEQRIDHGDITIAGVAKGRVLSLEMTPYQWASLVASHSGIGVPCTLRYLRGEGHYPTIDGQRSTLELTQTDLEGNLQELIGCYSFGLEELDQLIAKGKANKKELTELAGKLKAFKVRAPDIASFAVKMFQENAETIVAKSQAEVEAHMSNVIREAGLSALGSKLAQLPSPEVKRVGS